MNKKVIKIHVMHYLRRTLLIWVSIFGFIFCHAQTRKIQVACIGNSITAGARVSNPAQHGYPAVLSTLLNENGYKNYSVRNFGIGGATMLRFGKPNLWGILDSLADFYPDIVIIKAGTNETVGKPRHNWENIGDFEKDYSDYLAAIRKINPRCPVIICSPVDMVLQTEGLSAERKEDLTQRRPRIWQLRKRIKKLAKMEDASFLDLTKPFKGKSTLMTINDGVHPNQAGYQLLATLVFNFLVKKEIVAK